MLNLFLLQTLNGVQFGIMLFLVAAGLTLIFGVMDLINLSHGVLYMVGAYFAATFVALTGSFVLGLLLALPAALLLGVVLELAVFRRLYDRDHLDQVLATFGLILILNESVKVIWGAAPLSVPVPAALSGSVELFGNFRYPLYRVVIIAAGLATAAGLYVLVNFTRVGMLLRAGASNAPMVSALGVDIRRLFTLVFGLGAMLAGLAGALVAPILSVEPGMGDSVLILTFVVIVIGGVGSVRGAFIAAILVGVVDTVGRVFGPIWLRAVLDPAAASQTGRTLAPMLIYVLMAMVLFFRPRGLFPVRGAGAAASSNVAPSHIAERGAPSRGAGFAALAIFALLASLPLLSAMTGNAFMLVIATRIMIFALAALSLDLILGYGALVSFGHAAFVGIGAYAVAILNAYGVGDLLVQAVVAVAAAALFALVTGAISLRTRGVYFIMITLAFGQMLYFLMVSLSAFGGDDGYTLRSRSTVFGLPLLEDGTVLFYVVLGVLAAAFVLARTLVASRFGRVLRGTRDNAVRMRAIGFSPLPYQLTAYVVAGCLAALAGVLLANQVEFVSPAYMSWQRSGELIVMVVLGGMGTLVGPIAGAAVFIMLEEWLAAFSQHWKLGFGLILLLIVLASKDGVGGLVKRLFTPFRAGAAHG